MAVFTLDEDYSVGSLDICLPDTFYAIIKNIFLSFFISGLLQLQIETWEIKNCMSLNDQTLPVTELNPCKPTYKMPPKDLTCCFQKIILC